MLPCWIATFDKLNNFYSFLILVHFYRDFAQFGHVVSLGHYVMGSEEILKLEEYIKEGLEIHGPCLNVSTIPITAMGCRQCLSVSVV